MECPCKSGQDYGECCEPIIKGEQLPKSAEATMRARYSAFAESEIDFLERSQDPATRGDFDRKGVTSWSEKAIWQGLEILNTVQGAGLEETGTVEFIAKFEINGEKQEHHEIAEFSKKEDFWYFVDGKVQGHQVVRSGPKIGRNDPCHCGSGRKFKKCCAA